MNKNETSICVCTVPTAMLFSDLQRQIIIVNSSVCKLKVTGPVRSYRGNF